MVEVWTKVTEVEGELQLECIQEVEPRRVAGILD
jgi:hypothetical protein